MKKYKILLIEPIWNRNVEEVEDNFDDVLLLIEPIWNRNAITIQDLDELGELLIEPIWNRNTTSARRDLVVTVF